MKAARREERLDPNAPAGYREAAQQILVDKYSDSTRAPDALLSIAESQLQLGDKRSANRTLGRLIKDYPESEAAKVARERLPATR